MAMQTSTEKVYSHLLLQCRMSFAVVVCMCILKGLLVFSGVKDVAAYIKGEQKIIENEITLMLYI